MLPSGVILHRTFVIFFTAGTTNLVLQGFSCISPPPYPIFLHRERCSCPLPSCERWCLVLILSWLSLHVYVPKYIDIDIDICYCCCIKRLSAKSVNCWFCDKNSWYASGQFWWAERNHGRTVRCICWISSFSCCWLKKVVKDHAVNAAGPRLQLSCWKWTKGLYFSHNSGLFWNYHGIINSSLTYTNILVVSFQWLTIFQQKLWKCITALCWENECSQVLQNSILGTWGHSFIKTNTSKINHSNNLNMFDQIKFQEVQAKTELSLLY